jgi:hypothetical protein
MERGLLVELSPRERNTLLRIANGDSRGGTLHPGHIKRLVLLALIEDDGPFYQLTALGKQRVEGLANRDGLGSALTIASAPSTVPKPQP